MVLAGRVAVEDNFKALRYLSPKELFQVFGRYTSQYVRHSRASESGAGILVILGFG